jgi:hypothetical protein
MHLQVSDVLDSTHNSRGISSGVISTSVSGVELGVFILCPLALALGSVLRSEGEMTYGFDVLAAKRWTNLGCLWLYPRIIILDNI